MIKSKVITLNIAKQFLARPLSISLPDFEEISADAAKVLASHKGSLDLYGLKKLGDEAAEALGSHEGELHLYGLVSLSDMAAVAVARNRGDLWLGGVANPSNTVAEALGQHRGELALYGLTDLGAEAARALARHRRSLALCGLASLGDLAAAGLARHQGDLYLPEVRTLGDKAAAALARHQGRIFLTGLQRLGDGAGHLALAQAMVDWSQDDPLDLTGLQQVSPAALEVLATFDGPRLEAPVALTKRMLAARLRHNEAALQSGRLEEPVEWRDGRILPGTPPAKPLKGRGAERCQAREASWWLPRKVCDWFVQRLEDAHKAKTAGGGSQPQISPEAARLLRAKALLWRWLAERESQGATPAVKQGQARATASKQRLQKAAAEAGLSRAELKAKLGRLAGLVEKGQLQLAADMIAGFREPWLYQALLAGASIGPGGELKPGAVLSPFRRRASLILLLALASMPEGVETDASLRREALIQLEVDGDNLDLVANVLAPRLPGLRPALGYLGGVKELEVPVAAFLARQAGDLVLDDLVSLDVPVAEALSRHQGSLSLAGLSSVSEAAAESLSRHAGTLTLGLSSLTEPVAKRLARHLGDLEFPELKTIPAAAAAALAPHRRNLTLGDKNDSNYGGGLALGVEAARQLARHTGPLCLRAVQRLDAETALALAAHPHGLTVSGLQRFPGGPAGLRLCQTLAANPVPELWFSELQQLEPACAAALAAFQGTLCLSVEEWSDAALIALASHHGELEINPVRLSDEVAQALARRGAGSSLVFKTWPVRLAISDIAAEALASYPGNLLFEDEVNVSPAGAAHLVQRRSLGVYKSKLNQGARKVVEAAGTWNEGTWTRNS